MTKENLDEEIICSLVSLGWGEKETLIENLLSSEKRNNMEKKFYKLMQEKKETAPPFISNSPLSRLSRSRGGSAPIPIPNSSPPIKKRTSTGNQKGSPLNMATKSLQQLKLESSSPIIGSSPKRSWFSSFFSKQKEEKPESVRIISSKNLNDLTEALTHLNFSIKMVSNHTVKAKKKIPRKSTIKFRIEVLAPEKENQNIFDLFYRSGDLETYNEVCEELLDIMV